MPTTRARSFAYWDSSPIAIIALCGKIVFKHSMVLFFRIDSFVTPDAGVKAESRAILAAFRGKIPSVTCAAEREKSRVMTHRSYWQTMSFKSLATVVVISSILALIPLPPKLLALMFPALLDDRIEAASHRSIVGFVCKEPFLFESAHALQVSHTGLPDIVTQGTLQCFY